MILCPMCAVPNERHDSVNGEFAVCRQCLSFLTLTDNATALRVLTPHDIAFARPTIRKRCSESAGNYEPIITLTGCGEGIPRLYNRRNE